MKRISTLGKSWYEHIIHEANWQEINPVYIVQLDSSSFKHKHYVNNNLRVSKQMTRIISDTIRKI